MAESEQPQPIGFEAPEPRRSDRGGDFPEKLLYGLPVRLLTAGAVRRLERWQNRCLRRILRRRRVKHRVVGRDGVCVDAQVIGFPVLKAGDSIRQEVIDLLGAAAGNKLRVICYWWCRRHRWFRQRRRAR